MEVRIQRSFGQGMKKLVYGSPNPEVIRTGDEGIKPLVVQIQR